MSSAVASTLVTVSETMFPGFTTASQRNTAENAALRLGNKVVTSLPLQLVLYLNLLYFPCWLGVTILVTSLKYHLLNYLYQFVLITVLVAVIVIEIVRLYLGYLGNLTEKVSTEQCFLGMGECCERPGARTGVCRCRSWPGSGCSPSSSSSHSRPSSLSTLIWYASL